MKTISVETQINGDNFVVNGKRYRASLTENGDGTVNAYPLDRSGAMVLSENPLVVKVINE